MSGVSANKMRTLASTVANDVSTGVRTYRGGASDFTALITVVREIPSRSAIRACGTPSPASLLINAQSSKVITLPMVSIRYLQVFTFHRRNCSVFKRRRHESHAPTSRTLTASPRNDIKDIDVSVALPLTSRRKRV